MVDKNLFHETHCLGRDRVGGRTIADSQQELQADNWTSIGQQRP